MQVSDDAALKNAQSIFDSVAAEILAQPTPLRFDLAHSQEEREAVYRLRFQIVTALGWAKAEDLPEGLEHDAYDDRGVHIVAWDGEVLAGTARLVFPHAGLPLATEAAFSFVVEPRGEFVDWGRFSVLPAYRGSEHRVLWGLLARAWRETRARGKGQVCGALDTKMVERFRSMGLEFILLGPAKPYWKEERYPCQLDLVTSAPLLAARWNASLKTVGTTKSGLARNNGG